MNLSIMFLTKCNKTTIMTDILYNTFTTTHN